MFAFRCLSYAVAAISLVAAPHSAALAEDEAVVLKPSSPWNLDYGEHRCRIARTFGEGENLNVFYLEQWQPSTGASWLVAGPAIDGYRAGRTTNFKFGEKGDSGEFEMRDMTIGEFGKAVTSRSSVVSKEANAVEKTVNDPDFYERDGLEQLDSVKASGIDKLSISQNGQPSVILKFGDLEKPLAAMNQCMANLVARWGFEVPEQETVAVAPKPVDIMPVARRIQRNYPASAIIKGAQADFQVRLNIEADGIISDCQLVNLTLADDFDMKRHPCAAFMELAKYEPARTATGKPIRSYVIQRIRYTMSD
ncbi:energy transducer TonB [Qipengyuania atrilutea]|uniref:Energy transducer TonB n=1 Tax=Qipengyuania atrilutea TaxID=2744473 RepID=A0A850GZD8_9SPHN|nr:energy transducer TonB [Actirhodobacter atriluteus]NVD45024.1 energy transducer TonB [Actirhodobacter atriluteus]